MWKIIFGFLLIVTGCSGSFFKPSHFSKPRSQIAKVNETDGLEDVAKSEDADETIETRYSVIKRLEYWNLSIFISDDSSVKNVWGSWYASEIVTDEISLEFQMID